MRPELARFISRYDRGEYWSAHEELEQAWLQDRRPELKGLIQLAAARLHAERGNRAGALSKARSALRLLARGDAIDGLPLQRLRDAVRASIERLEDATVSAGTAMQAIPKLASMFDSSPELAVLEPEELPYRVRRHTQGYRIGRDPRRRDDG